MHNIINSIIEDLSLDISEGQEAHIEGDLEDMIYVMEDLRDVIPTNSWDEPQLIMTYLLESSLIPEIRDPLMQRAEYALSKAGV